jgi:Fur family ferric uptake transcriptional regulator
MSKIEELKSTGLKATLPRLKILELFQTGLQRHMTAEDVFRVLLEDHSDVALATVYRVLAQFEQADILIRSHFESGKGGL